MANSIASSFSSLISSWGAFAAAGAAVKEVAGALPKPDISLGDIDIGAGDMTEAAGHAHEAIDAKTVLQEGVQGSVEIHAESPGPRGAQGPAIEVSDSTTEGRVGRKPPTVKLDSVGSAGGMVREFSYAETPAAQGAAQQGPGGSHLLSSPLARNT
uniref:SMP domain-containing protein n=1 Tax=Hemiselmis andersenii TaxID=464988 RepID=A0A6U4NK66_HEMAN|mmetsp:Transcript_28056/g.68692  ORF Transcript_28056/g.68692 Transcript_28056/m.68692 type:complete len:156 (+) Transcript_28056:553-1020(+)